MYELQYIDRFPTCPFCRALKPSPEEYIEMMGKRIDSNDANAMYEMYLIGEELTNLKQGVREAFKFYHRAADLGSSGACRFLSIM
jgi:TPR repeat protein